MAVCATGTQCTLQRARQASMCELNKDPRATERAWASATGDYPDREALSRHTTHAALSIPVNWGVIGTIETKRFICSTFMMKDPR